MFAQKIFSFNKKYFNIFSSSHLDPELAGDLCLDPLQQRLLGAQLPLLLRLAHAALPH